MAGQRETGGHRHRVLLGDADVEEPVREAVLEAGQAGPGRHPGRDGADPGIGLGQAHQLLGEGVGVGLGLALRAPRPAAERLLGGSIGARSIGGRLAPWKAWLSCSAGA